MASLFISYSRKNIESARKLTEAFQGQDLDFWIDWEGIPPTVDWWKEIEKGIEEADIFLFLISPDSCRSKVCKQEIEHAIKNGKRLIPLVVCDVNPEEAPAELGHLNWIFVRETDDFNLAFGKLIQAIKTDYAWVQAHRELQVKALEWEKSGHENSFLLFGKELHEAEHLLATNTSKEPHPTDLQREYVHASRKAVDRRRARNTGITTVAAIALAALAIFGFVQARAAENAQATAENAQATAEFNLFAAQTAQADAVHQQALADANAATAVANEKEARQQTSYALSALALSEKDKHFDLSLLLSLAAFQTEENPATRSALLLLAKTNPNLAAYLPVEGSTETDLLNSAHQLLTPEQSLTTGNVVVEKIDDEIFLWDVTNASSPRQIITLSDPKEASDARLSTDILPVAECAESITVGLNIPIFEQNTGEGSQCVRGKIVLWDFSNPDSPSQLDTLIGHNENIDQILYEPRGNKFLSKSENSIILWNIKNDKSLFELSRIQLEDYNPVASLVFSPDNKLLAVGTNRIVLWNVQDPRKPANPVFLGEMGAWVTGLAFTPDGNLIVASYEDDIKIWDVHTGKVTNQSCELPSGTLIPASVLGLYDGKDILAVGDIQGRIHLCILNNSAGQDLPSILESHQDQITSLAFIQRPEPLLASGGPDGSIVLWKLPTGEAIDLPIPAVGNKPITSVTFDSSGQVLIARTIDNSIHIWEISNLSKPELLPHTLAGEDFINQDGEEIALNSHGILASGGRADDILLWDVSNPGLPLSLITLASHNDGADSEKAAFTQDGSILATGFSNGIVILWNTDPTSWVEMTCQRAGRNFTQREWERYFPNETYRKTCDQWPLETEAIATPSPMP